MFSFPFLLSLFTIHRSHRSPFTFTFSFLRTLPCRPPRTTTSSSSAPAPAAERWPIASLLPESGSCILERGDYVPAGTGQLEHAGGQRRGAIRRPRRPGETRTGRTLHPHTNYWVGGNTKFYGAALFRLRREDFGELRHHGGVSPAWPIRYDELEPYYTEAEHLYQVHGERGVDPTEPPASAPYRHPAGQPRAAHSAAAARTSPGSASRHSMCHSASCSTRAIRFAAAASVAPPVTAIPAWSGPSPMRRSSALIPRWSTPTSR